MATHKYLKRNPKNDSLYLQGDLAYEDSLPALLVTEKQIEEKLDDLTEKRNVLKAELKKLIEEFKSSPHMMHLLHERDEKIASIHAQTVEKAHEDPIFWNQGLHEEFDSANSQSVSLEELTQREYKTKEIKMLRNFVRTDNHYLLLLREFTEVNDEIRMTEEELAKARMEILDSKSSSM